MAPKHEAHRRDGREALNVKPKLTAVNHLAGGNEGRAVGHDIVDEHGSVKIGSLGRPAIEEID